MSGNLHLKHALVTGAASGIGAASVRALADSGRRTLALSRRGERLKQLAVETGCEWIECDVRDMGRIDGVIEEFQPDILVNNAGVGHGMTGLSDIGPGDIRESIAVNVEAPVQITARALPGMRGRRKGHIVNVGSIAGLHTVMSSLYGATKSAVHQFSQNLRVELAGTGIRVTEICPGRVQSEFYQTASGDAELMAELAKTEIRALQPEDVASAIMFAIEAPAHVNVSTIEILPTEQIVGGMRMVPAAQERQ